MKWKKLGKIFDPTEHTLINNCIEFAQSPQALVFDDYVRIYFSTREKDNLGKYLSRVSFVDFDKKFSKIIRVSKNEVISLGDIGCFDEHGIFPFSVLRDDNKILAFTTGWNRRVSVSADASIGLAISSDNGNTFQRYGKGGPVLTASLHEPFLVCDGYVCKINNIYHMWYIYGVDWSSFSTDNAPDRVYKIAHATSNNAVDWNRNGKLIIPNKLNSDECQALPTVIEIDNVYHMFFCYRYATDFRNNKERGYRLGYAYSNDLENWQRDDEKLGLSLSKDSNEWDSDMMCYPSVFKCDDNVYLLYNGNEFGRYGFGLAILEKK